MKKSAIPLCRICAVMALLFLWQMAAAAPAYPHLLVTDTAQISMIAGWTGTGLYIIAYILLCLGKLTAGNKWYHLLNITGALGLIINAADLDDYPSFVVNVIWMIIAIITLLVLLLKRKSENVINRSAL